VLGYREGVVELINIDLNVVCRIDYRKENVMNLPGNKILKQQIQGINKAPEYAVFYMNEETSGAYLALSLEEDDLL